MAQEFGQFTLLHALLVTAIDGHRVQIGNNYGKINGRAGRGSILGRVTEVHRTYSR